MNRMWLVVIGIMLCSNAYGADITVKGIPDGISEQQVKEWVAVLVERFENAKINQIQAVKDATDSAKTTIDTYRKKIGLESQFAKVVKDA